MPFEVLCQPTIRKASQEKTNHRMSRLVPFFSLKRRGKDWNAERSQQRLSDHDVRWMEWKGWEWTERKEKKNAERAERGGKATFMMAGRADASLVAVAVARWGIVLLSLRGKQNHSSLGLASIWATSSNHNPQFHT